MHIHADFKKIKKNKRTAILLSKMCRSKVFVTSQKLLKTLKIHYKIFISNLSKWEKQTLKISIFDGPLIINQTFLQIEYFIGKSHFAHIMHFY